MMPAPPTAPSVPRQLAALILFDIVDYSKLSDEHQYRTILLLSDAMRQHLDFLACQSSVSAQEVLLGMVPTGDGFYVLVRERYANLGVLIALSLRSQVLALCERAQQLFAGVRTAVHIGPVIPVHDVLGSANFVGSGLNDCARLCGHRPTAGQLQEVRCPDGNWLIASTAALAGFDRVFSFPDALRYRAAIDFVAGHPFSFADKHGLAHGGCLIEATRYWDGAPPPLPDLTGLIGRA